jgi:predicted phage tail protein
VYITETGGVGNVGVIMGPFFDDSKAMKDAGVETFYAAEPDGKQEGRPGAALSDDFKASMNAAAKKWFAVVARPFEKRGISAEKLAGMNARIYAGSDAVAAGLADEVVGSFESIVTRESKRVSHGPAALAHAARSNLEKRPMSISKEQWATLTPEMVREHRPDLLPEQAKVETEQPASIDNLEAAFPSEAAFVLKCVKAKATATQAKAAFADELSARLTAANAKIAELSKVEPGKAKADAVVEARKAASPGDVPGKGEEVAAPANAVAAVDQIKKTKGLRGPAAAAEARKTWPHLFR